jgi:hypothetical protein
MTDGVVLKCGYVNNKHVPKLFTLYLRMSLIYFCAVSYTMSYFIVKYTIAQCFFLCSKSCVESKFQAL